MILAGLVAGLLVSAISLAALDGGVRHTVRRGEIVSLVDPGWGASPTWLVRDDGLTDPNTVYAAPDPDPGVAAPATPSVPPVSPTPTHTNPGRAGGRSPAWPDVAMATTLLLFALMFTTQRGWLRVPRPPAPGATLSSIRAFAIGLVGGLLLNFVYLLTPVTSEVAEEARIPLPAAQRLSAESAGGFALSLATVSPVATRLGLKRTVVGLAVLGALASAAVAIASWAPRPILRLVLIAASPLLGFASDGRIVLTSLVLDAAPGPERERVTGWFTAGWQFSTGMIQLGEPLLFVVFGLAAWRALPVLAIALGVISIVGVLTLVAVQRESDSRPIHRVWASMITGMTWRTALGCGVMAAAGGTFAAYYTAFEPLLRENHEDQYAFVPLLMALLAVPASIAWGGICERRPRIGLIGGAVVTFLIFPAMLPLEIRLPGLLWVWLSVISCVVETGTGAMQVAVTALLSSAARARGGAQENANTALFNLALRVGGFIAATIAGMTLGRPYPNGPLLVSSICSLIACIGIGIGWMIRVDRDAAGPIVIGPAA
jgi:predicted MFS family arabinose efflux permease